MPRASSTRAASLLLAGAAAIALTHFFPVAFAQAAAKVPGGDVFAVVGEQVVTFGEYQNALASGMREKYYHAKPPEAEVAKFQREVGDQLVNRVLLLDEAKRRGIEPDRRKIDEAVAGYDQRYKASEQWRTNREKMLPGLIAHLERQSVLERFEKQIRSAGQPREEQLRAYYDAHRELFTEPEQVRLSLILLKVDPSSPRMAWEKAAEEADRIHQRLRKGVDFAELARMHSGDASAAKGGDLGYVHRGVLPDLIQQQVIDTLKPGALSAPVTLLEGVAIVRLEGRKLPQLRAFDDVRKRAGELWQREQGDLAWKTLVAELRRKTAVRVDQTRFLPLSSK